LSGVGLAFLMVVSVSGTGVSLGGFGGINSRYPDLYPHDTPIVNSIYENSLDNKKPAKPYDLRVLNLR